MCDGELYCYASMRTGSDSPDSSRNVMNWALQETGLELNKIQCVVGTGYGRVNVPFANRAITEIACHARGANFMYGNTVRTVLDMGGPIKGPIKGVRMVYATQEILPDTHFRYAWHERSYREPGSLRPVEAPARSDRRTRRPRPRGTSRTRQPCDTRRRTSPVEPPVPRPRSNT